MADGILYLDVDDEITSAAARIRGAEGRRVAVVLPYGSRLATSRINFRLLSRDALTHEKRLSVIAADAATRALAASAGLPVFGSVAEYESSDEAPRPRSGGAATAAGAGAVAGAAIATGAGPAAAGADAGTVPEAGAETPASGKRSTRSRRAKTTPADQATLDEMEAAELATAAAAIEATTPTTTVLRPQPPPPPVTEPVRREAVSSPTTRPAERPAYAGGGARRRPPWAIVLAIVGLVVLVGAVGAYVLLPSATIAVTPKTESVGPLAMTIVADPSVSAPDPLADPPVVPAETVTVDVATSGSFPATGKRVEKAKATGEVRFRNKDFTSSNTIPAGSIVSTANGIKFRTNATVTVPRANIVGLQVFPKTATVKVTAVDAGPEGNVEPNTVVVIPKGEDPISLDVNNPDAMTGGKRDEFPKVVQADIDAALATLTSQLDGAFLDQLKDPTIVSPGATVFPETRSLGTSTPTVDPATLLNQEVTSFELGLTASGTATAVNADPVRDVAEQRLKASIDSGHRLQPDSVDVEVAPAVVTGGRISFPASASAKETAILDPAQLKQQVLGKTVDEAKAILGAYGAVDVSTWPDWVSTIPTLDGRVDVTVDESVSIETPAPSPTP